MATVKHHKVVAALPAELEPDSIYYVRAGAGYDQYVTNSAGMIVAYPLNAPSAAATFFALVTVTASATGQTEFAIPGGYTPGAIVVFLNGSSLAPAHYTATNGATVVLASGTGVVVGSELVVLRLSAFQVADALPLLGTAADSSKLGGTAAAEFYRRGNILGTVSQSGGVPTGAIIERGSNANGVYWRFAGGLQVCITVEKVRPAAGGQMTFEWPAGFAGLPTTSTTVIPTFTWETPSGQYGSTGTGFVYFAGAGGANQIYMQAVGYWHN